MKHLIKFSANWADEFDCQQFEISSEPLEDIMDSIEYMVSKDGDGYLGFGSNQGFEYGELQPGDFEVIELNDDEVTVLDRLFGKTKFGTGIL